MVSTQLAIAGAVGAATLPLAGGMLSNIPGGAAGQLAVGAVAIFAGMKTDGVVSAAAYGFGAALLVNGLLAFATGR